MPVDYAKLLRMGMPLAVPHQKPPNKLRSHLYPYYDCENMTLSAMMTGDGYFISCPIDYVTVYADMIGDGELRSIYQSTNIGLDTVIINDVTMSGNGELRSIYQSTNIGYDSTTTITSMSGTGDLKRVLINYDNRRDDVTSTAIMTGIGTLQ